MDSSFRGSESRVGKVFSRTNDLRCCLWLAALLLVVPFSWAAADAPPKKKKSRPKEKAPPVGTTVQLPTFGVAINADGVLTVKSFPAPGRLLRARMLAAARGVLATEVAARSKLRKVSLVRLERAVRARLAAGKKPDSAMRHLAGLQRVQYVFCFPETGDVVVAGPAEGWVTDLSGRAVGVGTGRPVVLLEDLIAALRAYRPGSRGERFLGCTISPNAEGLTRLVAFQRTIPRVVPQRGRDLVASRVAQGMRNSLGMATIRVFGVSKNTHFAQVLIEADYRMKRIGTGLEPPPVKMATFIGTLRGARHETLQRWWFVPDYDCVRVTADRLGMELIGYGVQLLGEDKLIGDDGSLAKSRSKPNNASQLFTQAFTRKYPQIAAASPVYSQLRNMIDLAVVAAYIRREEFYERAGATLGVFEDEEQLPIESYPEARGVACAVNSIWKWNRLFTLAGGGVSIRAEQALTDERLLSDEDASLAEAYDELQTTSPADRWWWD